MCLAVPYEVLEVLDSENVRVRVGSGVQTCFTGLVDQVKMGDWVLIHAGLAIQKIGQKEAEENLKLIQDFLNEDSYANL